MQSLVTGDETWVHHYEPPSKFQGMEWKYVIAQDQEIQKCYFCRQNDVDAVLRLNGPILEHYQERRQTVNSAPHFCCV